LNNRGDWHFPLYLNKQKHYTLPLKDTRLY
jgi:hypothetical protein